MSRHFIPTLPPTIAHRRQGYAMNTARSRAMPKHNTTATRAVTQHQIGHTPARDPISLQDRTDHCPEKDGDSREKHKTPQGMRGLTPLVAREPYRSRLPGRRYHLAGVSAGWRAFHRAGTLHASLDIYGSCISWNLRVVNTQIDPKRATHTTLRLLVSHWPPRYSRRSP